MNKAVNQNMKEIIDIHTSTKEINSNTNQINNSMQELNTNIKEILKNSSVENDFPELIEKLESQSETFMEAINSKCNTTDDTAQLKNFIVSLVAKVICKVEEVQAELQNVNSTVHSQNVDNNNIRNKEIKREPLIEDSGLRDFSQINLKTDLQKVIKSELSQIRVDNEAGNTNILKIQQLMNQQQEAVQQQVSSVKEEFSRIFAQLTYQLAHLEPKHCDLQSTKNTSTNDPKVVR
jgi:hypothetical protein